MYAKPIVKIPSDKGRNTRPNNYSLKTFVSDFYYSTDECIEVIYDSDEYASSYSLFSGLRKAIIATDLPVEVVMQRGAIYLRKM